MNYSKKALFGTFVILSILTSTATYAQVITLSQTDGSNESTTTRQDYVRGWRRGSSELQQKINTLDATSSVSVIIPVLFGVEPRNLSPNFGDPRSNGRTHAGEDIMSVKGTPIVSPTKAVVLRIGVGAGEGNYIYTANPGGETFVYMHLDTFGEGVTSGTVLEKGSLIGYVGNTGNASGGAAHLHFEIHDSSGAAVDPFPRLTGIFSVQEKINYLSKILTQTSSSTLSSLLVTHFRSTFVEAQASGIGLPDTIAQLLVALPNTTPIQTTPTLNLPLLDLAFGSKGALVIQMQEYLINKNTGTQARALAYAGATGNFGPLTQAALIEYQMSVGVNPADGYYGATTRAMMTNTVPVATTPATGTTLTLLRNLTVGSTGEDVRMLQKYLNSHGYVVAATGAGSTGNESTYFGQATASAVIRFQNDKMISPAAGYVGPLTRAMFAK